MYEIWDFFFFLAENDKIQMVRGNSDPSPSVRLFHTASRPACGLEMMITENVISSPSWQRQ